MAQKQIKAVNLHERIPVYLTPENPYLHHGRKAGDLVEVSPFIAEKGIKLGHYSKTKPK